MNQHMYHINLNLHLLYFFNCYCNLDSDSCHESMSFNELLKFYVKNLSQEKEV